MTTTAPPNGLPRYRLLTGSDDDTFSTRVSEALDVGYQLAGLPALSFDGDRMVAAQAVLWPLEVTVDDHERDLSDNLDLLYEKQLEALQLVRRSIADVATARKRIELQVAQLEKRTDNLDDEAETATAGTRAAQRMAHLKAQREVVAGQEQRLISLSQHLQTQLEGFRTAKEFLKACDVAAEALATVAAASVTTMLESLVADELRKLVELRDAAVLTQEEFDCQKAKLLGQT